MGRWSMLFAVCLVGGAGTNTLALAQEAQTDAVAATAGEASAPEVSAPEAAGTPPDGEGRGAVDVPSHMEAQSGDETPAPILSKIRKAEEDQSLTLIGRSEGPVFIVESDGSMWEANKRQLTFYNRATPRVLETSRARAEEAAAAMERAAEIAKQRSEEKAKQDKAKADAKQAATERAAADKKAAEKAKEREEKIVSNYVNKEYTYGPNSVPESEGAPTAKR